MLTHSITQPRLFHRSFPTCVYDEDTLNGSNPKEHIRKFSAMEEADNQTYKHKAMAGPSQSPFRSQCHPKPVPNEIGIAMA
jgi:hypothetical protein